MNEMRSKPRRIQRKRVKGWRLPENAVIIDRTSQWGNPFKIGSLVMDPAPFGGPACPYDGLLKPGTHTRKNPLDFQETSYEIRQVRDAKDATALFTAHITFHFDEWSPAAIRRELGGKDLACFCPLPAEGEPDHCHGVPLLAIANPEVTADA